MNLRFRAATNQLVDTNQPTKIRRSIARLLTVIRQRQGEA
jgi:ribosomal protein L29